MTRFGILCCLAATWVCGPAGADEIHLGNVGFKDVTISTVREGKIYFSIPFVGGYSVSDFHGHRADIFRPADLHGGFSGQLQHIRGRLLGMPA